MTHPPLDLGDHLPGIALVPVPIEVLGHASELNDEIAGQVLGLDLAALLPPQPDQGRLVSPMMIRASEPPMKLRLFVESANVRTCMVISPSGAHRNELHSCYENRTLL